VDAFEFHPELFDVRNEALEALADGGYTWLSDFSSVDLLHDIYGLEVCGIPEQRDAQAIERLLRQLLPSWGHSRMMLKDYGDRDLGWKVVVSRDPEDYEDRWQRVS
jgi:hypothetical protein